MMQQFLSNENVSTEVFGTEGEQEIAITINFNNATIETGSGTAICEELVLTVIEEGEDWTGTRTGMMFHSHTDSATDEFVDRIYDYLTEHCGFDNKLRSVIKIELEHNDALETIFNVQINGDQVLNSMPQTV